MLRMMEFSELWYIENPGIFRSRPIFPTLLYSGSEAYFYACDASRLERFKKQSKFLFEPFSNMSNCDRWETTDIKIKLVLNILEFSDILRSIQEPCLEIQRDSVPWVNPVFLKFREIENNGIFRTLPYSQPSYIENLSVYRTLVDLEP